MLIVDPSFFADTADALRISNPAIVEKDFYIVQLLQIITALDLEDYQLVFAGGTCLTKAYQNTYRMSEDIDLKLVPTPKTLMESKSKQRQMRRCLHQKLSSAIKITKIFEIIPPISIRNEGKYQQLLIQYPQFHNEINSLRPHLQLEITESELLEPEIYKPISSLYAQAANLPNEIPRIACVTVSSTASEKFVSLLRRTAALDRKQSRIDDKTLIRHVYDLHLINKTLEDITPLKALVKRVIKLDVDQFGGNHEAFKKNPQEELKHGLRLLSQDKIHKERYNQFINPLVYHPSPANWDEAIATVEKMAIKWLEPA